METIKNRMHDLPGGIYYTYNTLLIAVGRMQNSLAYTSWEESQDFSELKKLDFLINPNFDMISHLVTLYVLMMQDRFFTGQSLAPLPDLHAGGNYRQIPKISALDGALMKFGELVLNPHPRFFSRYQR